MSCLDKSWKYIAEGNAHIVLEMVDSSFVLRLIKENGETADLSSVRRSVDFVTTVMNPLLFHQSMEPYEIIILEKHETSNLSEELLPMRPEHRKIKSVISNIAIKAPNLSMVNPKFSTNYCLEIKPKEGFMSASLKRYSKCYYCLKQYLKLQENQIESVSKYCPLDLFSGDVLTMKRALMNLIDNPQNNLKFFRNGALVYREKSLKSDFDSILHEITIFQGNFSLFLESIVAILLSSPGKPTHIQTESIDSVEKNHKGCCKEINKLNPNNFLHNLLSIQKLSEMPGLDTEEILDEGTGYISSILHILEKHNIDLKDETDRQRFYSLCNPQYLALISAVAKDCSIMISFSEDFDDDKPHILIWDQKLSYKLAVTDLEPKSAQTLRKRKKTEIKMIEIYKKYTGDVELDENDTYRFEFKKWSCRGDDKEKMALRKSVIQQTFKKECGLLIDVVKQGVGTTNDGNTARRFFRDAETTARITGISKDLIERFYVILQTIACGERIELSKFSEFCMNTAELYINLYPWYYMPSSVHKLLVHGSNIIQHFGAIPIGKLSEEAAEARNKDFRKYRENYSRKISRTATNEDILHNLLLSSDPKITSLRPLMVKRNAMVLSPKVRELLVPLPAESEMEFIDVDNLQDSHSDSE